MPASPFPYGSREGWRPDPARPGMERYWDGQHWSDQVRAQGTPDVEMRVSTRPPAGPRPPAGSTGSPESARTHRVAGWAATSCTALAVALTLAVLVQLNAWRQRSPEIVTSDEIVDKVTGSLTGGALTGAIALLVVGLVTLTLMGEWVSATAHHELTDERQVRSPLPVVVMAMGPGLLVPLVGPWVAARGLAQLWHATRPPTLTLSTGMPGIVVVWLATTVSAQVVPPLVVAAAVAAPSVSSDLLGAVALAGLLATSVSVIGVATLGVIVRQCDQHLRRSAARRR